MAETKIEWADYTFNPWRGCTRVSPACEHCYAESLSKRNPKTLGTWGPQGTRVVGAESYWQEPIKWNKQAMKEGVRKRVFCASLADVFEDWKGVMLNTQGMHGLQDSAGRWHWVEASDIEARLGGYPANSVTMNDVRRRLFTLIDATPNLDWLILTKRPENIARMMPKRVVHDSRPIFPGAPGKLGEPLPCIVEGGVRHNVWLGTTVESQKYADERIPHLLSAPAVVRFLSCEPLLGPINLPLCFHSSSDPNQTDHSECAPIPNWVIAGGESGHHARPSNPDWFRSLRDQCQEAGVAFHFKQWGEYGPEQSKPVVFTPVPSGVPMSEPTPMFNVGKTMAGRLLDGREWNEFP